jgi:predicted transcriptional regulator
MNDPLSRRERQIMDVVYRLGRASVSDVHGALPDAPSYSAVRALMAVLTEKGHLLHEPDGRRYLYRPTVPARDARTSALERVVSTFFDGSPLQAALALVSSANLGDDELKALEAAVARAREEGR